MARTCSSTVRAFANASRACAAGYSLLAQGVQRLQRGLILRLHGLTKPARVQLPRLFPRGAANAPVIGIVLQRIAVRLAERRELRL